MSVTCKRCGAAITADAINISAMAAKCQSCNALFSIADQVDSSGALTTRERGPVPLPERFSVDYPAGGLQISWRWPKIVAVFMAFFAVFWNGFLCVWFSITIMLKGAPLALFAVPHLLAGPVLIYVCLMFFLNRTTVTASQGMLLVRHGPLPTFGNRTLPVDTLRQLYCVEHIRRSRGSSATTYSLHATQADGRSITLVKSLPQAEQALYVEQQIERFLGIRDEPVGGELPR